MRKRFAILSIVLLLPLAATASQLPLELDLPSPCQDADFLGLAGGEEMTAEWSEGTVSLSIDPSGISVSSDQGNSFSLPAAFSISTAAEAGGVLGLLLHYPFASDAGDWVLHLRRDVTVHEDGSVEGEVLSFSAECASGWEASAEVVGN